MDENEFLVLLQAKLDEAKSKGNINTDIDKIQGQLNKLKLQAIIDENSIKNITDQLSKILNQKITVSNIAVDGSQAVKSAQQTGKQIKDAVESSLKSINSVKLKGLSNEFKLGKLTDMKEIRQQVDGLSKELNSLAKQYITAVGNGNADAIQNITNKISNQAEILRTTLNEFGRINVGELYGTLDSDKNFLKYFKGKTFYVPEQEVKELKYYGDSIGKINQKLQGLGIKLTTVKDKGVELNSVWEEMITQTGRVDLSGIENSADQLKRIAEELRAARGNVYGDNLLENAGKYNAADLKIDNWMKAVTDEGAKVAQVYQQVSADTIQSSNTVADTVIQNEEKKQQAIQQTANIYRDLSSGKSIVKSGVGVINFEGTNNAAKEAQQYFRELLKDERAIIATTENFGKNNNLTSFTVNIKRASGEVESLKYALDMLKDDAGNIEQKFYRLNGSSIGDTGAIRQIRTIENTIADYTAKLAQFKSTNNNILSGLSAPLSDFENKLKGLHNGTVSIDELKNSFSSLNAEASKITSNLSGELNKVDKAVRNISKGNETISGLRAEFKGLSNMPKEINSELTKLSKGLQNIKKIESAEGRTANWSLAYKEWQNEVDILTAKLRVLKKEQSNSASTQVFKTSDLRKAKIPYMTKVSNTIEKQMEEIQKMANAKGWQNFNVKGFEQSDGLIKSLTLTVTEAEGAVKKLNFQREQLQGKGKAQPGLMQTGDIEVIKTAAQAQEELAQKTEKTTAKIKEQNALQADKIQFKMDTGGYESKVESLIAKTRQWTDENGNARISTVNLSKAFNDLTIASNNYANSPTEENQRALISAEKELDAQIKSVTNSVKNMNSQLAKDSAVSSLHNKVADFMSKNGRAVKYSGEFNRIFNETAQGVKVTKDQLVKLNQEFDNSVVRARNAGKLGKTFFQTIKENMRSFSYWTSSTFLVMQGVTKVKQAVSELKEINSIMTEISKVSQMTSKELEQLGSSAFESASKYGKKASDYLTGIRDFSRGGFRGEKANEMAELSVLAQAAGDMSAELSNKYLIATDSAYKLNGEISKLNDILDGQNYIANNNTISMEFLADATKVTASQAASAGIAVEQMSAAIGVMGAVTQEDGEVAGRAFKAILMNLQQVKGELDDGEIIDDESLTKYEKACNGLGVSLKEVKNGVLSLRDPMKVLEELSESYTALDKSDVRRANLINAVGGKYRGNHLNALLEHWNMYEEMLEDYANGSGSAMNEAMKSANNWE